MSRLPALTAKQVLKVLQQGGLAAGHQRGSHLFLVHPQTGKTTTVPMHPGNLKRGLLKEIIKQAGLTENEFRDLL
ncbi:MAG: type II toxin-antitoxin system HicA family toxin [Opitutales bacterium]